jgi:hypothetical protein
MVLQLLSTSVKKPAKKVLSVILEGREATSNDRFTEAIRFDRRSGGRLLTDWRPKTGHSRTL